MKGTRAALRYAKAILDLAKDKGLTDKVNIDLLLINKTVTENPDLLDMLHNPIIKSGEKKSALNKIFAKKTEAITMNLINLLIENKRLPLLTLVVKEYLTLYHELKGVEVASVTSAIPLTKDIEAKILKKIKQISDNKITLKNIIDPSIIGGFILRVGDKQFDSSVSNQLNSLLANFKDNHYISKIN